MKSVVIELNQGVGAATTEAVVVAEPVVVESLSFRERAAAYAELTKPRITFLIVLTAAAGFCLAPPAGALN